MQATKNESTYLYKYRPIDKHTMKILINNELWFASPKTFNDPFDCKFDYVYQSDRREDWLAWLEEQEVPKKEKRRFLKILENKGNELEALANEYFNPDKLIDAIGVVSFSQCNDSILLWSHYAENHQGICLGFKTDGLQTMEMAPPVQSIPIFQIQYQNNLPPAFNGLVDHPIKLTEFLKVKHRQWRYEKEYRLIALMEHIKTRSVKYNQEILGEIIFGVRTSESDKSVIKEIVKNHYTDKGYPVRMFQVREKRREFKLVLEEETG